MLSTAPSYTAAIRLVVPKQLSQIDDVDRNLAAKEPPSAAAVLAGLAGEVGSREKIHDRCCQGLIASSANQRRTVDGETAAVMPLATHGGKDSSVDTRDLFVSFIDVPPEFGDRFAPCLVKLRDRAGAWGRPRR